MAKTHRIEANQLIFLMVVCRSFSLISFIQAGWTVQKGTAEIVGVVIGFLATIVLMAPSFALLKNGENIITFTKCRFPKFGNFLCIFYWILLIYFAIDCATHFGFFMMSTTYPTAPRLLILVIFLICISYFCSLGLEPMARANVIFFSMSVIGLIFITLILIPKMDMVNLVSPIYEGFGNMLYTAFLVISRNAGAVIFLIFAGNVKGSIVKSYIWYSIIVLVIAVLISFLTVTVLGEYAATKPFSTFALASLGEIKVLKRMDSIHLYIWIFSALIKASAYIFAAQVCLEKLFNMKYREYYLIVNILLVGAGSYFLLSDIQRFNLSYSFINLGITQIAFVYVMPTVVFLLSKIKKAKDKKLEKRNV